MRKTSVGYAEHFIISKDIWVTNSFIDKNLLTKSKIKKINFFFKFDFLDALIRGDIDNSDMNLYWDSWDRNHLQSGPSPRPIRSRTTRSSVPSEDSIPYHNNNNNNFNNDRLAQASSVVSLSTSSSPPTTPLLKGQG